MTRPALPEGMHAEVWRRICGLPARTRDRVLERSAILVYQGGLSFREADQRALAEEAGITVTTPEGE